jgi:hypothetical protein
MKYLIVAVAVFLSSTVQAQQHPDPVLMQHMLTIAMADRVTLLNRLTETEGRLSIAAEEIGRLQAKIKDLEAAKAEPGK